MNLSRTIGRPALVVAFATICAVGICRAQQLEISVDTLRFPCTAANDSSRMEITLTNRGIEPITIGPYDPRFADPPFIARPLQRPEQLLPDQSRTDTIWFIPKPPKQPDPKPQWEFREHIVISYRTNLGPIRSASFEAVGFTGRGLMFEPFEPRFAKVEPGDTAVEAVTVINQSCGPRQISSLSITGNNEDAFHILRSVPLPATLNAGGQFDIDIACAPIDDDVKNLETTLFVNTSDGGTFSIKLRARVDKIDIITSPALLDFDSIFVNATTRQYPVRILNREDSKSTRIQRISLTGRDTEDFAFTSRPIPFLIAPNDEAVIGIEFTPKTPGPKLATLVVYTESGDSARTQLRGYGLPPNIRVGPRLVNVGAVFVDSTRTLKDTIIVFNDFGPAFRVDRIELRGGDSSRFNVTGPINDPIVATTSRAYSVTFTPDAVRNFVTRALFILSNGIEFPINLRGEGVVAATTALADTLDFGPVVVDSTSALRRIGIINSGNSSDQIRSIDVNGKGSSQFIIAPPTRPFPITLGPNGADTLWLDISMKPQDTGAHEATIELKTRYSPPPRILLKGIGSPEVIIAAEAREKDIDMGTILVNDSYTAADTLRIINTGNVPLQIRSVTIGGDDPGAFTVTRTPTIETTIAPDQSAFYSVTFSPTEARNYEAEAEFDVRDGRPLKVKLTGRGAARTVALQWIDAPYDFGEVNAASDSASRRFGLINLGNVADIAGTAVLLEGEPDFILRDTSTARMLRPTARDTLWFELLFKPNSTGAKTARVSVTTGSANASVTLTGTGVADDVTGETRSFTAWLDSTNAPIPVNTPFDIVLRLSQDLLPTDGVTAFKAMIRFEPTALALLNVRIVGTDHEVNRRYDTIELAGSSETPISGSVLATLTMQGLVTGRPDNRIDLVDLKLTGNAVITSRADGRALLSGCDINYGVAYGQSSKVTAIKPMPIDRDATVRYFAPQGSSPTIRVVDMTGREVTSFSLPQGNGAEQDAGVSLDNIQDGFYMLELRVGTQRSSVPVIIGR